MSAMSATRLLVLGAVRIFQPAHGYLVRRELMSWQVDEWANLNPGSVYNALRTLTRNGLLVEDEAPVAVGGSGPGARAVYRLSADGETEFLRLVRDALWKVHPFEPAYLLAGLSFWWALSREETLDALRARRSQLEAHLSSTGYAVRDTRASRGTPDHVVEHFFLQAEHLRAELVWVEAASARIDNGEYGFAGEDPRRIAPPAYPFEARQPQA